MAVDISNTANPAGAAASGNIAAYSGQSIGVAANDRVVVLAVGSELASAEPISATINFGQGVFNMLPGSSQVLGAVYARCFYLTARTGTTADFTVTFGANPDGTQNHVAVYRVVGGANPTSGGGSDTDADPISVGPVTVPASGGMVAICADAADTTARTWTGLTESLDEDAGSFRFSTGLINGGGSITTTVSGGNNEDAALSYLVFAPGSPTFVWPAAANFSGAGGWAVDASILEGADLWPGSVEFAGAGTIVANTIQLLRGTTALTGAGGFALSNTALIQPTAAAFAGAGGLSANLTVPPTVWQGTATFAGAGGIVAATLQFVAGVYDETGAATASDTLSQVGKFTELEFGIQLDRANLIPGDVLEFRVYLDGVALDSYVTPSITVAASTWNASSAWAGVGSFSAAATITRALLEASAALAGSGQFNIAPQLRMAVAVSFAGAGSLTAELAKVVNLLQGAAAFAGAGQFSADGKRVINLTSQAFSAIGNFDLASTLRLGVTASFGGIGSFSADAVQLGKIYGTALLQGAGALTAATNQRLAVNALYAGAGAFTIQPTNLRAAVSAIAAGAGSFDIRSALRMRASAQLGGTGLFFADLSAATYELQGQAQFDGLGELTALGRMSLPSSASFDGAGNFTAEAMRFIPLSETFSGAGSFLVGDVQQLLAAFLDYGAIGSLTVESLMFSAREEWLVCASIGITPEMVATPTLTPELPAALTINPALEGSTAMKVC